MKTITVTNPIKNTSHEHYMFNKAVENCPCCGTPLENVCFSWRMFHGEASSDCCNSVWQIKDYGVDKSEEGFYKEFFQEFDNGLIECKVYKELWQPFKDAFEKTGTKDCEAEENWELVKEFVPKS